MDKKIKRIKKFHEDSLIPKNAKLIKQSEEICWGLIPPRYIPCFYYEVEEDDDKNNSNNPS